MENLWKTGYDEAASVGFFNPALYAMDAQDAINHCFTRVKDAIDFTGSDSEHFGVNYTYHSGLAYPISHSKPGAVMLRAFYNSLIRG